MNDVLSSHEQIPYESDIALRVNYDLTISDKSTRKKYLHLWHEEVEILYFHQGNARVHCGDKTYIAQSGDVLFINSCEVHWVEYDSDEPRYDCLIIDIGAYCDTQPGICETRYLHLLTDLHAKFENDLKQDPVMTEHVLAICEEFREKGFGFELMIKSHIFGLLAHMFRHYLLGDISLTHNIEYYNRIKPAIKYMQTHLSQPISLDTLAQCCNLSNSHFSRLFRQVMSVSPMQHLASLRLQEVASLLKNSHYSITQIAIMTGFDDTAYLSRKFKETFGLSPMQFKKMNSGSSVE